MSKTKEPERIDCCFPVHSARGASSAPAVTCRHRRAVILFFSLKRKNLCLPFRDQLGLECRAMSLGVCSDCFFNFCLYDFTKFWQESRAHTRVLAFMNLMGCESQADSMNFGYIFQTSTMTLFIQTWQPECRLTLWVINFHSHKTSAATNLILCKKNAYEEADLGCKNMLDYYSMYAYQSVNLFGY